ncbi:phage portal protein [Streptomyces sp. NPDC087440]|uniref:phage portal protein n=1 Tax=Streptomyces sp. NPDC087440 TaxID=3365790 RepID=UPI0037F1A552
MPRQFLPALRGLLLPRQLDTTVSATPVETKSFNPGNGFASMTYAGVTNVWGTEGRADGWDMDRVIVDGYERSIWTFKAVESISKHASELPVQIGRGGDERRFEETLDDHPLLRLLNTRANPMETGDIFKKRLSAQLLLSKKGVFVEKTYSRGGTLTRVDLLPPDRVEIVPDPYGDYIRHFQFTSRAGVVRELPPERVVWLRDPHPTDPFSGVTPLEAAGLSVDLDVKARTYNISFIDNDGRPGGVLGIDVDGVDSREIDRIQQRLATGAHHAGEIAIVGTGPGGLNYLDTSIRPREMAYETLSATSKGEILAAFGVPESVIGNASERTYANADREEWTFWDHTALPHLNLIASGFDSELDDGWTVRFDTQRVQALEFPRRQEREEARAEFNAGLISIDEYREIAGRPAFGVAQSRALWISPQKAPVPANEQDAAALGLGPQDGLGGMPDEGAPPALETGDRSAAATVADAREQGPGGDAAAAVAAARSDLPAPSPAGTAADAVDQARATTAQSLPGDAAAVVAQARESLASSVPGDAADDVLAARTAVESKSYPANGYEVTDDDFDTLAHTVATTLTAVLARQQGVITARLHAPKIRKNTRYWEPDGTHDLRQGEGPLSGERVVSAPRWSEEVANTLAPVLTQAAAVTAANVGQTLTGTAAVPPAAAGAALLAAAQAGTAISAFLARLAEELQQAQKDFPTLEDLAAAVTAYYATAGPALVERLAEATAVATINGAAESAAESAGSNVVRAWVTRGDDRVRPAHKALHGTVLPVGTPYTVNGFTLRYPGDPFAPTALTINCRCRLHYSTAGERP